MALPNFTYNMSYVAKSQGLLQLTQRVNTELMHGYFGLAFLIGLALIMFGGFMWSTRDVKTSMLATVFITFILSVLMRAIHLLNNNVLFITLIGLAFAAAFTWKTN